MHVRDARRQRRSALVHAAPVCMLARRVRAFAGSLRPHARALHHQHPAALLQDTAVHKRTLRVRVRGRSVRQLDAGTHHHARCARPHAVGVHVQARGVMPPNARVHMRTPVVVLHDAVLRYHDTLMRVHDGRARQQDG